VGAPACVADSIIEAVNLVRIGDTGAIVLPIENPIVVLINGRPIHAEFDTESLAVDQGREVMGVDRAKLTLSSRDVDIGVT